MISPRFTLVMLHKNSHFREQTYSTADSVGVRNLKHGLDFVLSISPNHKLRRAIPRLYLSKYNINMMKTQYNEYCTLLVYTGNCVGTVLLA